MQVKKSPGFIERHGLWTDEQRRQAQEIKRRIEQDDLHLIRLAWADPYGASRAKAVTLPGFLAALTSGHTTTVASSTLDASGARIFSSFIRGGGMELPEMTGSPNIVVVPDPGTFRVLPWAPGIGWVLCDEYFTSGVPFHFSPRHLLRKQVERLASKGMELVVGLEIEWYLLRAAESQQGPYRRARPAWAPNQNRTCRARLCAPSESNLDAMQDVLSGLVAAFEKIDLPLRSIENEWGPGRIECTFAASAALEAADQALLFRTATRQICRRMGYFAAFMCRPALKDYCSNGWHLHQSLVESRTRRNAFMPDREGQHLSQLGLAFVGGLLEHASSCSAFATPTVNGYRRFRANSLAPDRATWCYDHRGVMIRVLGGKDDPATRIETALVSRRPTPTFILHRRSWPGSTAIDNGRDRDEPDKELFRQPAHAADELASGLGCPARRLRVSVAVWSNIPRLLPASEA